MSNFLYFLRIKRLYWSKKIITSENFLKDKFWNENKEIKKVLLLTYQNYNKYFDTFAPFLEENKIKKTNLVKSARIDRKKQQTIDISCMTS